MCSLSDTRKNSVFLEHYFLGVQEGLGQVAFVSDEFGSSW